MLLHHYLNAKHGEEALQNGELFASRVSNFNDPLELSFELSGYITEEESVELFKSRLKTDARIQAVFNGIPESGRIAYVTRCTNQIRAQLNGWTYDTINPIVQDLSEKTIRMVCFCDATKVKPEDEILMWSHYASKHEGIRISFEFPADALSQHKIREVIYQPERVKLDRRFDITNPETEANFRKTLETKSNAWYYEKEVRLIAYPKNCRVVNEGPNSKEFISFKPEWVKVVDIGVRADPDLRIRIPKIVREKYPEAECRLTKTHPHNYSLIYEQVSAIPA